LKGDTGPTGSTGPTGPTGAIGPTGTGYWSLYGTTGIYYNQFVGIGTSGPQHSLDISGTVNINTTPSTGLSLTANGTIQANQFNSTSDYRIKENIIPLSKLSDQHIYTIDNLEPCLYENKILKQLDLGLIAHEVQEHFPFLVTGNKDDDKYQAINYIGLIPLLIHEIKQLKEILKNKLE